MDNLKVVQVNVNTDKIITLDSLKKEVVEDANGANNNNPRKPVVIKQEPVDEDDDDRVVVDADKAIVIKTEAVLRESDDEDEDFLVDYLEDSDGDDDDDFESDELESNSASSNSRPQSKLSEEEEEEESGFFDFNGLQIETKGNYSKCPKCDKNIKSTFIIRHLKLHDLPDERFVCPEDGCKLQVNRINNLFRHLREIHKSKKPYVCKRFEECGCRFARAPALKAHNMAAHAGAAKNKVNASAVKLNEDQVFPCEFPGCGKEYKKRHHLKEHERKHTGDMKYACEVCGKKFYIQAHMKRHLYSHTGIKPHVCRWKCGAIFASYGGRMKHERINHYEENPLKSECDICGRPFKNQQQLVKHRMTHLNPEERKDFRCQFCHIMFDTVKLRERHEERHKDGEEFKCETCDKVFKNEKNLSHHVKTHHLVREPEPESSTEQRKSKMMKKKEPPPKHHCHICGPPKLFCLTSLRRHLARIHSTNYKCPRPECGKYFKEKAQLDNHVEIHRLRECHVCGKKFQRKQNADIHLLGVHGMTKDDLAALGRWNPKMKEADKCPDYMTRKSNNASAAANKENKKRSQKTPEQDEEEEIEAPEFKEEVIKIEPMEESE